MKSLIFFVLIFACAGTHAAFAQGADASGGGVSATTTSTGTTTSPESTAVATGTPARPAAETGTSTPLPAFSIGTTSAEQATTSNVVTATETPLIYRTPHLFAAPEPTPAPEEPEPAPKVPNDTVPVSQTASAMSMLPIVAAAGVMIALGAFLALRTKKNGPQKEDPCGALKKEYETAQTAYDLALKNITLQEALTLELKKEIAMAEELLKVKVKEYAADVTHEIMEDAVGKKTSEELSKAVALADEAKATYDDFVNKHKLANDLLEILKGRQQGLIDEVREKEAAWKLCTQSAALAAGSSGSGNVLPAPEGEEGIMHGTIIEQSLRDKSIFDRLTITRTRNDGDWVLHDVEATESQVLEVPGFLDDGPWYAHFWQDGNDEMIVTYKDKVFRIDRSNRDTWKEAIAHGMSLGIPEAQLDFLTEDSAS